MLKNKYLVYKNYYNIVMVSIKEIIVNEKVSMISGDDVDEHANLYFMAKFIPEKIIGTIMTDCNYYFHEATELEDFKEINSKIGFYIENDKLYFRHYIFDRRTNTFNEKIEENEIVGFVDSEGNSPFIMYFDSDECAQLWLEASRSDWDNHYGRNNR